MILFKPKEISCRHGSNTVTSGSTEAYIRELASRHQSLIPTKLDRVRAGVTRLAADDALG